METIISASVGFSGKILLKKLLIICGILSSLLYAAMNIFVAMADPGYSSASQTVSELSAIDASTRPIWVFWSFVYTFLVIAFGWGIWLSAGRERNIRVLGALIFTYGALGLGWPFAPMHTREVIAAGGGTFSDTMHIVFSIVTVFLMLLVIGFGAVAFGKRFRLYSIMTIIVLLTFGILTGMDAPNIEADLPTPLIGVWERINIGAFLLWVVVLAVTLLLRQHSERSIFHGDVKPKIKYF
jgi:hypothetical protein